MVSTEKRSLWGRPYDGVHRISFLISPDGTIAKTYPKVKPVDHAGEVLRDMAALNQSLEPTAKPLIVVAEDDRDLSALIMDQLETQHASTGL